MKRLAAVIAVIAIASSFSLALAGDAVKASEVSYTGWITDQWCGAKNAKAEGKACALDCYKKGSKLVLYVPETQKTFALDQQQKASEHVGVEVKVTGMMDGETFKVSTIEEVKKG